MKYPFNLKSISLFVFCFALFAIGVSAQKNQRSNDAVIASLEKDIPTLIKAADIPGMSAALIRDGKIVWKKGFGFSNAETKQPVTNETIFEAASLSKVVFAYGILKLVDEGKLDLDTPLNKYLGNNYEVAPDDARINQITARRVLSHSAGFPNWRSPNDKYLPINFTPGEKFSYSGEGFEYLKKTVEKITGLALEDFMQKNVLQPLKMTNSSFMWQDKFKDNAAFRHDLIGTKLFRNQGKDAYAAASLRTTADDYARLIAAILNGTGLKKKTIQQMLMPQIKVEAKSEQLSWGLGVGLEMTADGKYFWHWGDQGDTKAYFAADSKGKNAIVYFANGTNGLSFAKEILDDAIGGTHPAIAYLDYARYDNDPARILLKSIIEKGAAEALKNYAEQRKQNEKLKLGEFRINRIGAALFRLKKFDEAIEVFKLITADFPDSASAWSNLAEAFVTKGDKESAIKAYEKSLEINPNNTSVIEQLQKLKL